MFFPSRPNQLNSVFLSALIGAVFFLVPGTACGKVETNLDKALKSGKKDIVFSGKESDNIVIKKGVSVTGASIDKATITGTIKMENGSSLANVNVAARGNVITILPGASVTLINVTVRGGEEAGIYAPGGGGTLTVKNSRITKNRKGFYILPGKNLNLSGNVVTNNDEEGLDVRAGASGSIVGNHFAENGEGGAEIIAGGTSLRILRNTFSHNQSSGLAIQSYRGSGKAAGSIALEGNAFVGNGGYGIHCLSPSGGGGGPAFYRATVRALDNSFRGNREGMIDRECGGIVNRSSAAPEAPQEAGAAAIPTPESVPDELALREEATAHLEAAIALLHDEEYFLEQILNEYEAAIPWWQRLREAPITGEAKEEIIGRIAIINGLRETVAAFPREFTDEALERKRQETVLRSLRRMEELRQYFERLQKPVFQLR